MGLNYSNNVGTIPKELFLDSLFIDRYTTFIDAFMQRMRIYPSTEKAWIGVSGGIDSIFLLSILWKLKLAGKITSLNVVHINYGMRQEENYREEQLVREYCHAFGLPLRIFPIQKEAVSGANLEAKCRDIRYQIFRTLVRPGDRIYLAHHIDDSFEWSLLSQMKSGSLRPSIGIPVVRGAFARPLLCLTKRQIIRFHNKVKFPYCQDSSNLSQRFERNFLRHSIIPQIKERFPSFLKHYVVRSNQWALKLGLSREVSPQQKLEWREFSGKLGGGGVYHHRFLSDLSLSQELLIVKLRQESTAQRGSLRRQLQKLIDAAAKGRFGPMKLSGGVLGYMLHGAIFFIHEKKLEHYRLFDQGLARSLQQLKISQIPTTSVETILLEKKATVFQTIPVPFLIFGRGEEMTRISPSMRRVHPLLPLSTQYAVDKQIWFQSIPRFLFFYSKKTTIAKCLPFITPS